MRLRWQYLCSVTVLVTAILAADPAGAQQVSGTQGSPDAVMTPDGTHLPAPTPPFTGAVMPNFVDSQQAWPPQITPPQGAPNILLILTDDVGYAAPATFGGVIPTPALDRIAQTGLRYTQFHTTALCSPTRAALLTGRNHHNVGFGNISELSSGFPGYNSIIPPEAQSVAATLQRTGYATAWFGKNHNVPPWEASAAGPFTNWPIGMGFDYFYGFVGGDTSQWQPGNLFRNTTPIHPYVGAQPGTWNLITAMADDAIAYIRTQTEIAPNRPWFVHYAPGGTHAPHHPTQEWVDRITAMHLFDQGWERLRDTIFANQQRLGVLPPNAELSAWPEFLQRWEQTTPQERELFIRQVNVYAAYLAYTDFEIGRVIDEVERLGQRDNTLIIYISGDNGGSTEGGLVGTPNEVMYFNGIAATPQQLLPLIPVWGTDRTYNHMAAPWTWAFSTPYRWVKQVASHFGGTRNGMAISWPARITDRGGIRPQFHHVIDVVPTILEAIGIEQPQQISGIAQRPLDGTSMMYTFPREAAAVPSHRRTQYFEILGNRAIYHDGWIASTTPPAPPWDGVAPRPADAMNGYQWELYNLAQDPSQVHNLAAAEPARLRAMQDLFTMEGMRNQVFPLNGNGLVGMLISRPGPAAGRRQFVYAGPSCCTQANAAPNILNRSFRITADIEVPQGGGTGMLVTQGGRFAGWGFYLREGRPIFTMNLLDVQRVKWEAPQALGAGRHTLVFDFTIDPAGPIPFGHGGTGVLTVDGQQVATQTMPHSTPFTFAWDETFDVGQDTGTPVDDRDHQVPALFAGQINRITVDLGDTLVTPEAIRNFGALMAQRAAAAAAPAAAPTSPPASAAPGAAQPQRRN